MKPLLVRDVMTIGVPVCRDSEWCGAVLARLEKEGRGAEPVVVLDEAGRACGWVDRDRMEAAPMRLMGEVMDEDIPTVQPEMAVEAALELIRSRGVEWAFLMHDWPGPPRPAAMVSLTSIEEALHENI